MKTKTLAIIPARGGSKRIPKKNIKSFCGYPIIKYTISAAIDSGCFDEVMVSTDDPKIAKVAIAYGAKVPFLRSSKTSDDHTHLVDVVDEVLAKYAEAGREFEHICCILPTAPFITPEKIVAGLSLLKDKNADSVFTVTQFSYPIERALHLNDNKAEMRWPEYYTKRSQDLPISHHDAGQFYWLSVDSFRKQKKFFADNSYAIELSELEAQDIDTPEDWRIAEIKYNILRKLHDNKKDQL